jgi:hypothetical protein
LLEIFKTDAIRDRPAKRANAGDLERFARVVSIYALIS